MLLRCTQIVSFRYHKTRGSGCLPPFPVFCGASPELADFQSLDHAGNSWYNTYEDNKTS